MFAGVLDTPLETDENYTYYFWYFQDFPGGFFRGGLRTLANISDGALVLAQMLNTVLNPHVEEVTRSNSDVKMRMIIIFVAITK